MHKGMCACACMCAQVTEGTIPTYAGAGKLAGLHCILTPARRQLQLIAGPMDSSNLCLLFNRQKSDKPAVAQIGATRSWDREFESSITLDLVSSTSPGCSACGNNLPPPHSSLSPASPPPRTEKPLHWPNLLAYWPSSSACLGRHSCLHQPCTT